ncbi:MAG TPA: DUF1887 family CARF protein [Anaerolineaceae bacterium]|nr:DUF1887 family CARF protein [Anaerolineaceae bacterium]HPN53860.1 DUF1887 family CARF protein [Anaerolineaceae bacterium]
MTILLSLTGEQAIPNLIPFWQAREYLSAAFVVSERTEPIAWQLSRAIKVDPDLHQLQVLPPITVQPYDLQTVRGILTRWITQRQQAGQNVVMNITGGTKVMTMAAVQAVHDTGVPMLYVCTEENQIITYRSDGTEISREAIRVNITAAQYMAAHGLEISDNPQFDPAAGPESHPPKAGDDLEQEVFQKLCDAHCFDDVRKNVFIRKPVPGGWVRNELDIMVVRNGRMAVGSCKSRKKTVSSFDLNRYLYELFSLSSRESAGIYCGKALILASDVAVHTSLDRARTMKVRVIRGADLERIAEIFMEISQ